MGVEDLWGELPLDSQLKLPVTILKEQATILGEKTNKILEAVIKPVRTAKPDRVGYEFTIIAPALSNYEYEVFYIIHSSVFVYPVTIYFDFEGTRNAMEAQDERGLINHLREILSSERVHKVIASLLAQSRATTA